jgi:uncharacterized protein (TIGR03083 family)
VAFKAASGYFVRAVQLVPDSQWDAPGLGSWSVRELVGHANRAHTTIEEYLAHPRPPEPRGSRYFSDEAIAERGREAVAALGQDPKRAVDEASRRVTALVDGTPPEATVGSPARTMTLSDYLPSRTAELTIHGLDVVDALGLDLEPPSDALEGSLEFMTRLSVRNGSGQALLLAMSGRGALPSGYSVY